MNTDTRPNSLYAAALVAAAGLAAPADAAESVTVSFRDLDLGQPEARVALHWRVRAAARAVCGAPEREEARAHFARRDCYRQAIAQALGELESRRQLVASLRP